MTKQLHDSDAQGKAPAPFGEPGAPNLIGRNHDAT